MAPKPSFQNSTTAWRSPSILFSQVTRSFSIYEHLLNLGS